MKDRAAPVALIVLVLAAAAAAKRPKPATDAGARPSAQEPAAKAPDAESPASGDTSPFSSEEFEKEFLGSYGISPDVEPRISPEERALLETVLPLLSGDVQAAGASLRQAATEDATALFDFVLGNLALQQGDGDEAVRRYETAVAKFPAFRRAWRNLGLVHVRDGRYAGAITAFTRTIELGGADAATFGLLGHSYAATGDPLAAESAFRNALLLDPDADDWRLGLVRAVIKQEKYEDAASLLRTMIARQPEKPELWILQANAFIGMKQPMRAAENLEIVARMEAATPESMYLLGDIYLSEERPALAAAAYARAIEADRDQPTARSIRAVQALASRGHETEALGVARAARETFGDRLTSEDRRALLRLQARADAASGRDAEAARVLEEVLEIEPLDGDALLLLGKYYAAAGDPERAMLHLERAAGLEAHEAQARARWGQILVSQGRHAEALPLLKRARELAPSEELSRYVEQVERAARASR